MRTFAAAVFVLAVLAAPAAAQDLPKPGPELEVLKKMVGTWDIAMTGGGMEAKGTATYKMDLGGLWLAGAIESEGGGMKFSGRGYDTYDAGKKKYIGVWVDSMSTAPMVMEGTWDAAAKAMTMTGAGPGLDGKPTTWKSVATFTDDDSISNKMYIGGGADPVFTITYKRKK
jgi:hypothetical protein